MRHFAVHYNPGAPRGLPPAVMAHSVIKYSDGSGTWLCFLMEPPPGSTAQEPLAVHRVPAHQVAAYEEFPSAAQAMAAGVTPPQERSGQR
jgi:hypothetical protein